MQSRYVYLLSHHHEYGSADVRATINRDEVMSLFEDYTNEGWGEPDEDRKTLEALLETSDEELHIGGNPHNLMRGWGGVQLHVVKIEGGE